MEPRESAPTFAQELEAARAANKPFVALRPDHTGALDDVVIHDVDVFRAEMMSDSSLWMMCRLTNGEEIHFSVSAGKNHSAVLNFGVSEFPETERVYLETGSLR